MKGTVHGGLALTEGKLGSGFPDKKGNETRKHETSGNRGNVVKHVEGQELKKDTLFIPSEGERRHA